MKKLKIEIELENDTYGENPALEVSLMIKSLEDGSPPAYNAANVTFITCGVREKPLRDTNGKKVGSAKFVEG